VYGQRGDDEDRERDAIMMSLRGLVVETQAVETKPEAISCYTRYTLSIGDCFDGRAPSRKEIREGE
jgi:hypothetical protein